MGDKELRRQKLLIFVCRRSGRRFFVANMVKKQGVRRNMV